MYHKHHTKGIIIAGVADGMSDKRVGIFTENLGFLWAKVQSVRSGTSRLRSHCQDFTCGEFSLVHGKTGWRVVSIRSDKNLYELIKNSPEKIKILANIFRLLRKLLNGEEANQQLFSMLDNFLGFLVVARGAEATLAEYLILSKILYCLGFLKESPELSTYIGVTEINEAHLALLAPKRVDLIKLINDSLKAAQIGS